MLLHYVLSKARSGATVLDAKWFHFSSGSLVAIVSALSLANWNSLVDAHTAAEILFGLGLLKAVLAALSEKQKSSDNPKDVEKDKL